MVGSNYSLCTVPSPSSPHSPPSPETIEQIMQQQQQEGHGHPSASSSAGGAAASSPHTYFLLHHLPKKPNSHITTISCLLLITPLLLLFFLLSSSSSSIPPQPNPHRRHHLPPSINLLSSLPPPPTFAYLLTGSSGDAPRLLRLLLSVYHPRNLYLLHLDLLAPQQEREDLARRIRALPTFRSVGNVHVIGRADYAYKAGSSALAALLHGAAVLLRIGQDWDWFVNLDAARDYPLLTQDDLLHVFSFLPRHLNFVQHSSHIGWRESRKLKPIIVDPGLYLLSKTDMFYATQKRDLPNAYKLFTGSPSVILSRNFVEHCILGTDNLPRILLMYFANTPSCHTAYFQTLLCNSPEFNQTIINDHFHYVKWDTPPRREPHTLTLDDFNNMTLSGAAFATGFSKDSTAVLDQIDREVLNRDPNKIVPGGWCLGGDGDKCTVWGATEVLRPGPGATRLAKSIVQMLADGSYRSNRCIWE